MRTSGDLVELIPFGTNKTLIVTRKRKSGEKLLNSQKTTPVHKVTVNVEMDWMTNNNHTDILVRIDVWTDNSGADNVFVGTYYSVVPWDGSTAVVKLYDIPQGVYNFRPFVLGYLTREILTQTVGAGILTVNFTAAAGEALLGGDTDGTNEVDFTDKNNVNSRYGEIGY